MIYDAERFNDELVRLSITPTQCHLCMCLLETGKKREKLIIKYKNNFKLEAEDLKKLQDLGYLENMNGQASKVDSIHLYYVTPKLKELLFVDDDDLEIACEEAWQAFPKLLMLPDKDGKLKPQSSRTISRDDFGEAYTKLIRGNIILHKRIVEMFTHYKDLVKKQKVHGLGLKKVLETKHWEVIEEMIELEEEDKDLTSTL